MSFYLIILLLSFHCISALDSLNNGTIPASQKFMNHKNEIIFGIICIGILLTAAVIVVVLAIRYCCRRRNVNNIYRKINYPNNDSDEV